MKALRVAGNVFIVIGATFLFFVVYELVGTAQITNGHQRAFAAEFDTDVSVDTPGKKPTYKPFKEPKVGEPWGRLRIPSIKVDYIVVEGTTLDDLAKGPGHYRGTPFPGQRGSVGIAGHRTGWGSPFIDLDRLKKGDRIIIDLKNKQQIIYEVTRSQIVEPGDVWVLDGDEKSTARKTLTLTTCTPKYTSRDRLIVWADQVKPKVGHDQRTG